LGTPARTAALILTVLAAAVPASGTAAVHAGPDLPLVRWNDNHDAAGVLEAGVLTLRLELVRGEWRYLGDDRPGVEILAFRETGHDPQNPGPLIRVPLGTEVRVWVANPLDVPLIVHGLAPRRVAVMDSLVVAPGETREARFVADVAGTFYYWGTTTGSSLAERIYEDSQLNGALIVDPAGARPPDETMILSIWFQRPPDGGELDWQTETFTINGRPWPLTERLAYDLGDSVRWRLVNLTDGAHPMHLHGFFFQVEATGDGQHTRPLWPDERPFQVTRLIDSGGTVDLSWLADRPGGWPFHCHISYHVVANALPGDYPDGDARDAALLDGHSDDPHHHVVRGMGGLMMGIYIRPPDGYVVDEPASRRIRLYVVSDSLTEGRRRFGYALAGEDGEPPDGPATWPGPTIVTHVGEPTAVTVINRTAEPTQVHWHGLEIESYFDGVAGVGGYPGATTPAILPGDSFEMRITPRRAGSYMYHTHLNDIRQQSAGLYGGFVVLPAGQAWNPELDRVYLLSTDSDPDMSPLLNGARELPPITLEAGTPYRLRFMNITLFNAGARLRLTFDGFPVRWRALGKDGADFPSRLQTTDFADRVVSVGETLDFEFLPREPGEYRLEARSFGGRRVFATQRIAVTAAATAATR
jgi:FtsP/CotA-like multicopper oxidase with cupredoxin domain